MHSQYNGSGLPIDVAKAALWLASDDSSFVTGQSIVVDGGATVGKSWKEFNRAVKKHCGKFHAKN